MTKYAFRAGGLHDVFVFVAAVAQQARIIDHPGWHSGRVRSGNSCRINGCLPSLRKVTSADAYVVPHSASRLGGAVSPSRCEIRHEFHSPPKLHDVARMPSASGILVKMANAFGEL